MTAFAFFVFMGGVTLAAGIWRARAQYSYQSEGVAQRRFWELQRIAGASILIAFGVMGLLAGTWYAVSALSG